MNEVLDQWSRLAAMNLIGRTIIERDTDVGLETHCRITEVKIGEGRQGRVAIAVTVLKEGPIGEELESLEEPRTCELGGPKDMLAIGFNENGEITIVGPYSGPFTIEPDGKE